jgi:excinuclease ABC subunit A
MREKIVIHGAREHNLKNIDLELPRNKLIVITGLSGSGKSSLAFDTIYAEGQRKYVESISTYARQFLGQLNKPDVEHIEGLSPAISIQQRTSSKNPRSTVATATEIYDYLRLLFANVGTPHCPKCGKEISSQTIQEIVDQILDFPEGTRIQVLAPVVRGARGQHEGLFDSLRKEGFVRVRIDGDAFDLNEKIKLRKGFKHNIEVVVDRLVVKEKIAGRLTDSIETALKLSRGTIIAALGKEDRLFSSLNACVDCGISFEKLVPRMFSFNSPYGACPTCHGLGTVEMIDPELVIPNKALSLRQNVISPWNKGGQPLRMYYSMILESLSEKYGFSLDAAWRELPEKVTRILLEGTGKEKIRMFSWHGGKKTEYEKPFEGILPNLQRRYEETESAHVKKWMRDYMSILVCPACKGHRLRPESIAVTIDDKNIADATELTISEALEFFQDLKFSGKRDEIAKDIIKEIVARLSFMKDVGLSYLTLERRSATLSGGEEQRIRLATQIGAGLVGVMYILDEPSIGLHQRDNGRLIETLRQLRDMGNTIIVVEHDEATSKRSSNCEIWEIRSLSLSMMRRPSAARTT